MQGLNYEELTQLLINYRNNYYQMQKLLQDAPSVEHYDEFILYKQKLYMQSKYATNQETEHYNSLKSQITALQQEKDKVVTPINKKYFIIAGIIGTIVTFGAVLIVLLIAYLVWKIMHNSQEDKAKEIDKKIYDINMQLLSSAESLESKINKASDDDFYELMDVINGVENEDGHEASGKKSPYLEWKEELDGKIAKNDTKYQRLKELTEQEKIENQKLIEKQKEFSNNFIQLPGKFANNVDFVNFAINELEDSQAMNWQQVVKNYNSPLKAEM